MEREIPENSEILERQLGESFNALYISAPAVTKQINLLESSLGLQLFVRTHRGLILTEAGKSLYRDAKYIIQYCRSRWSGQRRPCRKKTGSSALEPLP